MWLYLKSNNLGLAQSSHWMLSLHTLTPWRRINSRNDSHQCMSTRSRRVSIPSSRREHQLTRSEIYILFSNFHLIHAPFRFSRCPQEYRAKDAELGRPSEKAMQKATDRTRLAMVSVLKSLFVLVVLRFVIVTGANVKPLLKRSCNHSKHPNATRCEFIIPFFP